MNSMYQNWVKGCLAIALFSIAILLSSINQLSMGLLLIWLQVPIYLLHEFEEHVYPGRFKDFINQYMFKSTQANFPVTDKDIFWINIPFIWICFPLFAILAQNVDIRFGLLLPCLGLFNATTHIIVAIIKRRYNPGLLASIFLNYPSGVYTLYYLRAQNTVSALDIYVGFFAALMAHLIILLPIIRRVKKAAYAKA